MRSKKNRSGSDILSALLAACVGALALVVISCGAVVAYGLYRAPIVQQQYQEELEQWQAEQDAKAAEASRIREQREREAAQAADESRDTAADTVEPVAKPEPESDPATKPTPEPAASTSASTSSGTSSGSSSGTKTSGSNSQSSGLTISSVDSSQGNSTSSGGSSSTGTKSNGDGTYTHDFSGGRLLGTTQSNKYHNSDCSGAKKIPPENEIWFDSVEDAKAHNYEPCGNCYR